MRFSQSAVLRSSPREGADILFVAGQELVGKPLRRASWQEIAEAIQSQGRLSTILLMRLRVARNREDALRVLRMAVCVNNFETLFERKLVSKRGVRGKICRTGNDGR